MTWQTVEKAKNKPNLNFAKPQRPRKWQHHTQPLWGRGSEEDRLHQFSSLLLTQDLPAQACSLRREPRGRTETQLKEDQLWGAQDLQDFSFLTSHSLPDALADKPFCLATESWAISTKGQYKDIKNSSNQPGQVTIQGDQC